MIGKFRTDDHRMGRHSRFWLIAGFLLAFPPACGTTVPEEEAAVTPTVMTAASMPTRPPTPTLPSFPAPLLIENPPPDSPSLAQPSLMLPRGWKDVGSEAVGVQLAVPASWVDVASLSPDQVQAGALAPHSLLFADSAATGSALLAGERIERGAFVIAMVTGLSAGQEWLGNHPIAAMRAFGSTDSSDPAHVGEISSLNQAGLKGAYVDIDHDPFGVLPVPANGLRLRLVTLTAPETGSSAILLLAAPADQWQEQTKTFTSIAETVILHEVDVVTLLGTLASGDSVNGRLSKAATDIWAFEGESGRYATITVTPLDSSIDLTLALVNSTGRTLESVDNGYAGDREVLADVLLRQDDDYFIEIREFFDEPGRYELHLVVTAEPQFGGGGRLAFGEQITGNLPAGARHNWTFRATAGQVATVIVTPLEQQLDVILGLLGPDAQPVVRPLDEGFSGDPELLVGVTLPITGEYTIVVYGFADHGGRYTVSLDEGGESTVNFWEAGDLIYGDVRREVLRANEAHAWYFDGREGDEVTVVVTPLHSRLDLDLWLLDPNVHKLVMKDEFLAGVRETVDFTLPDDGQYIILVREFFGEPGPYEVSLSASGSNFVEQMGSLGFGQAVSAGLAPGRRAAWTFSGERDQIINIDLAPLHGESDLLLVLKAPDGSTAIVIDDTLSGAAERLEGYSLPLSGEWTIVVQEFFDAGAEYSLLVTLRQR
jgi:hypothetical protein